MNPRFECFFHHAQDTSKHMENNVFLRKQIGITLLYLVHHNMKVNIFYIQIYSMISWQNGISWFEGKEQTCSEQRNLRLISIPGWLWYQEIRNKSLDINVVWYLYTYFSWREFLRFYIGFCSVLSILGWQFSSDGGRYGKKEISE